MEHYICTGGCRGVSKTPGVCQTDDCPHFGHALEKCDCLDGKHHGAFDFEHDHAHSLPAESQNKNGKILPMKEE